MLRLFYFLSVFLGSCYLLPIGGLYADKAKSPRASMVRVDGSSTVFPITEAVAEEFLKVSPRIRVVVGVSGTGGGFKKFLRGETDITNASRKIKSSEVQEAEKQKIEYLEIPVAFDGISVVVNRSNDWVDFLSTDELKQIWNPQSAIKTWKDVRESWPPIPMRLYGPGTDSGTFDYFTEVINGKAQASRSDFNRSEDDNVLVQGVAGDRGALGYFGYAYYMENKDKIKLVPIKSKGPARYPTESTIKNETYAPLSRPLFIYVNKASLKKINVKAFLTFYLEKVSSLLHEIGYIPLPQSNYATSLYAIRQGSK